MLTSLIVSGFLTVVSLLDTYVEHGDEGVMPNYNATLMPPDLRFKDTITTEGLSDRLRALQHRADAEVKPKRATATSTPPNTAR